MGFPTGNIIVPPPLSDGDRIALVAPSGWILPEFVDGAVAALEREGFRPVLAPHLMHRYGSFSAPAPVRLADMADALTSSSVKAVLCVRGGYGAVHLLEGLSRLPLRDNPKWVVGYSDISAIHGLMACHGIASIHGPMARHLATTGPDDPATRMLFAMLRGTFGRIGLGYSPLSRAGCGRGPLYGGNLAVLASLASTRFNLLRRGSILFIEDIGEPAYRVERMLYELRLSGVLESLNGLIIGHFTGDSRPLGGLGPVEIARDLVADYGYPVAVGAPIGHLPANMPMPEGLDVTLEVGPGGSFISLQ